MTFTTRPEIKGTFGVVASTHWLASAAGMGMLERGGNAFDAAVCAGFVLHVVEPHKNGPAGDMPAILWDAAKQEARVLCGQGPAPAGATIKHYRGLGLDRVPGTGNLAAAVPLAFDAWMLMLRDYGTMSLAEVLEPALHYADKGHPTLPSLCDDQWKPRCRRCWRGRSRPTPATSMWSTAGATPSRGRRPADG